MLFDFLKKKDKNTEKNLIDIFNEKFSKGNEVYNLFNFYRYQYNVEEIVGIIKLYELPFNMEFKRDQDLFSHFAGYTGGSRYPDYAKNFVKVYILDEDYEKSIKMIEKIKDKYVNEKYGLDGIKFFIKNEED